MRIRMWLGGNGLLFNLSEDGIRRKGIHAYDPGCPRQLQRLRFFADPKSLHGLVKCN